jgi:phosphoesterase RecJ-like protein
MDHNKVAVEIYQKVRPEKAMLVTRVLSTMEFFGNGRGSIAYISLEMLRDTGATMDESEGIVEQMRNINGVEIAAILKEDNSKVKVGMRSKTNGDVASIATHFGGGGHKKAAGFIIEATLDEAKAILVDAIEAHLESLER